MKTTSNGMKKFLLIFIVLIFAGLGFAWQVKAVDCEVPGTDPTNCSEADCHSCTSVTLHWDEFDQGDLDAIISGATLKSVTYDVSGTMGSERGLSNTSASFSGLRENTSYTWSVTVNFTYYRFIWTGSSIANSYRTYSFKTPVCYTLSVSRVGSGTVTDTGINCGTDCTESYAAGTSVTLTASPASGWSFAGWSGDCSGTGNCNLTMNSNKNVTATFSVCECFVEGVCRSAVPKVCMADDAKDHSISELGDAIDDNWCTYNEHDGCEYVASKVQVVNGQVLTDCCGPHSWWEGESCGGDGGSSSLYGEKKVQIDSISKYVIKARLNIDDNSWVWINGSEVPGLHRTCCGWTDWVDVTSYFNTGWNTIKFRAEDTCSGGRYFNLDWDISLVSHPPNANFSCSTSGCHAYSGSADPALTLSNDSTDPDGEDDIVGSEWRNLDITGHDITCPAWNILCDYTVQSTLLAPGDYEVQLEVIDRTEASDIATGTIDIKKDATADFVCSLYEDGPWQDCSGFKGIQKEYAYFKDDSTVSDGAAFIKSRIWECNGVIFASETFPPDPVPTTTVKLIKNSNTVKLTIKDNKDREDTTSYIFGTKLPLPTWREIAP